jgi:hypothetical protein
VATVAADATDLPFARQASMPSATATCCAALNARGRCWRSAGGSSDPAGAWDSR